MEWQRFEELTPDKLYELLRFRQAIFVVEQGSPYPDLDGLDRGAWHLLLRVNGALTGYLRLIPAPPPVRIGRVTVAVSMRGRGLGHRLMEEALAILPRAIFGSAGGADFPGPFGAVLSKLWVRTERRAL